MKTRCRIAAVLGFVLAAPSGRADPLDELIADVKSGVAPIDPAKRQATVQAGLGRASGSYANAMVDSYIAQVKASIIDPENHGGWPCRSALVYQPTTRRTLTAILRSRFERKPDAIIAYAILCPAIYERNDELLTRALNFLKVNDPFLHDHAQARLATFWLPFINQALKKQTPTPKQTKESKDDPFSVLPR